MKSSERSKRNKRGTEISNDKRAVLIADAVRGASDIKALIGCATASKAQMS